MATDDNDTDLWHFDKERLAGRGGVDVDNDESLARLRIVLEVYAPEAERRQKYSRLSFQEKLAYRKKAFWPVSAGIALAWPAIQPSVMNGIERLVHWLLGGS